MADRDTLFVVTRRRKAMSTVRTAPVKETVSGAKLDPMPIEPSQVIEGDPQASGAVLWISADRVQRHLGVHGGDVRLDAHG